MIFAVLKVTYVALTLYYKLRSFLYGFLPYYKLPKDVGNSAVKAASRTISL